MSKPQTAALVLTLFVGAAAFACSSTATSTSTSTPGGDDGGAAGSSGDVTDAAAPEPADAALSDAGLAAPNLTRLIPMAGGIHVVWTNTQPDCDAIEGERSSATEAYKVVFTTAGTVGNKHDPSLTASVKYTYRLRCKKGAGYSYYSNEMTGSP
jgi:hypothetical protein